MALAFSASVPEEAYGRRCRKFPSRRNFTFIELCVVIVIIGILAALTGPRLLTGMSGRGIGSAARRLAIAGEHAGNLAATSGRMHVLELELRTGLFYITAPDYDEDATAYEGRIHSLPDGVRFTGAWLEEEPVTDILKVRFAPDGWADNAFVYVEDEKSTRMKVAFTRSMGKVETSRE